MSSKHVILQHTNVSYSVGTLAVTLRACVRREPGSNMSGYRLRLFFVILMNFLVVIKGKYLEIGQDYLFSNLPVLVTFPSNSMLYPYSVKNR